MPHAVDEIFRNLVDQDVEVVLVVHLEDLGHQAGADRVGLAGVPVSFYFHRRLLSAALRRATRAGSW